MSSRPTPPAALRLGLALLAFGSPGRLSASPAAVGHAPAWWAEREVPGPIHAPSPAGGGFQPQAIETPGDGPSFFGSPALLSGTTGLIGANGAAYVFRNLDTASGTVTQDARLTASGAAAGDYFGSALSLSGASALAGSLNTTVGGNSQQGVAYLYHGLDTATGTVTQSATLTATGGTAGGYFGDSVSLSGALGVVGASGAVNDNSNGRAGAAYVFRNLDTATGTVHQSAKLIASDGVVGDDFGQSVSLSGTTALVGIDSRSSTTPVYVFHNLDTASGTKTEDARLVASGSDLFGDSVSLSGAIGMVGAPYTTVFTASSPNGYNSYQGAAYVFRNLDTATGTKNPDVMLIASDGAESDQLGSAIGLSGAMALAGVNLATVNGHNAQGAAYLFRNLDTASGTVTENVKLYVSNGAARDFFGASVALDGDRFIIGASGPGKTYSGTASTFTVLDAGNATASTSGLSFVSQDNWIIGRTTSNNQVTLNKGDRADVSASGRSVIIGRNPGSNDNTLIVQGTLTANTVTVSSPGGGAVGNTLRIAYAGASTAGTVSAPAGGIVVNSGGILLLTGGQGITDRIGDTTPLTFNGGGQFTLTNGISEGAAPTGAGGAGGAVGMGTLTLRNTGSTSPVTLDFSDEPTGSAMVFNSLSLIGRGSYVSLLNWTGALRSDNGASANDRLLFASDPGYTLTDLAHWQFHDDAGLNLGQGAEVIAYNGYFEIVPAPEPSTWMCVALLAVGAAAPALRRRVSGRAV